MQANVLLYFFLVSTSLNEFLEQICNLGMDGTQKKRLIGKVEWIPVRRN